MKTNKTNYINKVAFKLKTFIEVGFCFTSIIYLIKLLIRDMSLYSDILIIIITLTALVYQLFWLYKKLQYVAYFYHIKYTKIVSIITFDKKLVNNKLNSIRSSYQRYSISFIYIILKLICIADYFLITVYLFLCNAKSSCWDKNYIDQIAWICCMIFTIYCFPFCIRMLSNRISIFLKSKN